MRNNIKRLALLTTLAFGAFTTARAATNCCPKGKCGTCCVKCTECSKHCSHKTCCKKK